jgi:hypothetical protein
MREEAPFFVFPVAGVACDLHGIEQIFEVGRRPSEEARLLYFDNGLYC